jgi:hypothetical protein
MPKIVFNLYGFKKESEISEERLRECSMANLHLNVAIELPMVFGIVNPPIPDTVKTDWLPFEYDGYVLAEDKHYFRLAKDLENRLKIAHY